ncbi:class I adenylate-forming enzyme family protein [Streptomyces sp. NPDC046909]|uniref:class I adenylate-forming enzyme family protein n=1 Tax=Streptomyces sp. NPDC046909 TaxID=3155617 RepID=UPI0033C996FB
MPLLTYPRIPLDGLLRRAARRDPEGAAISVERAGEPAVVTFAELDRQADRVAHWLAGTSATVVGVANPLDPGFAAAYYGTARAGRTIALLNPLLGEARLAHVCAATGLQVAFVPASVAELLVKIGDRLPELHTVVVIDAEDGVVPGAAIPLGAALAGVPEGPYEGVAADVDDVVCVQFTTGTTGRSKGVRLTHRNLVANAAQIALAHDLDGDSVTVNHLPLLHTMHLNSAVYAGASQVLCALPDPVASLGVAARVGATHYYGLPARLTRLAGDERLGEAGTAGVPAGARLKVVMSGGSALAPAAARRLRDALRVPVVQGYGLAELSPLATNQALDADPEAGAVGRPLAGTECRVVSLGGRSPVEVWSTGEIQIRGPQLMAGYLDDDEPSPVDAEGWLTTGDVGYLDDTGGLHLVDRLSDVFKYDNELVAPSAVERILAEDARVAECIVVDWPDPVHGSLVWAGVVLREIPGGYGDPLDGPPGILDVLDSIAERANARLGHADRIRRLEALDAVPRNPGGKPTRRELRKRLHLRAAAEQAA